MRAGGARFRAFVGVAVLAAVAACEPADRATGPADGARPEGPAPVGPDVRTALQDSGSVRVVVALHPTAAASRADGDAGLTATDIAALRREVSALTDAVVDRIGGALDGVGGFATVPALTGTVRGQAELERLASDPAVRRIDRDVGGGGGLEVSVPQIGANLRHSAGNRGTGVWIAILDTGVDTDNPSLDGRVVHQACFGGTRPEGPFCPDGTDRQTGPGAAEDDAGHGTHVTGIVASAGRDGGVGVAPGASIVALKVMDDCGFAGCFYAYSELIAAWDYLIVNHDVVPVRAVNMSLGTSALFSGSCDETTAYNMAAADAVATLRALGVLVFASSMNNGSGSQMASPACLADVVSVGAVDDGDALANYSNGNASTDLVAPGTNIQSLAVGGGVRRATGTSMASPHAAGCAALLWEARPELTADQVLSFLRDSAVEVDDFRNSVVYPRVDCRPAPEPTDPESTATVPRPGP